LTDCEAIINRGIATFVEVGDALLEIRDRRLYRDAGYQSFDLYCRERWGWSRISAHRQIQAAKVVKLLPIGNSSDGPANEAQARALAPVANNPDAVKRVWHNIQPRRRGEKITARRIHEAVRAELAPAPSTRPSTASCPLIEDSTGLVAAPEITERSTVPTWTEAAAEARLEAAIQLEFTMWHCPDTDRSYLGVILGRLRQKYLRPLPIGHNGPREAPPRATKKGR
jgi:hypothetical protein